MKSISLSIEELIYCFYSEGLFEQGMGLKQTYFPDMDDEQFELILQASCRSLLAKNFLNYKLENHRYVLTSDISLIIKSLNYSNHSLKISKFIENGKQDSISLHISENGVYQHNMLYEGQVHQITEISGSELTNVAADYMNIKDKKQDETSELKISLQQTAFENMLTYAEENPMQLQSFLRQFAYNHTLTEDFTRDLIATKGKMNSIMLLAFNEKKEPQLEHILFFVPGIEKTWFINKSEDVYIVSECNKKLLESYFKECLEIFKETV